MSIPAWIFAVAAAAVVAGLVVLAMRRGAPGKAGETELPEEWPLIQRSIFSAEERALYRQLRAALPHHTILAKLPLVRFCQPMDRNDLGYWFKLLGPIHVSFVVCAENGRVLAALDIEKASRPTAKRVATIKQSVLEACRIRYVRCRSDQLPTATELQLLVPAQGDGQRPAVPGAPHDTPARAAVNPASHPAAAAQAASAAPSNAASSPVGGGQWYESGFSQDSFFAPETQRDPFDDTPVRSPATAPAAPPKNWAGPSTSKFQPGDFGPAGDAGGDIIGRR